MLNAAIIGMGWWGETLVEAIASSALIRVVAMCKRSYGEKDLAVAAAHHLRMFDSIDDALSDPAIEAIILATPPSGHAVQVAAAARAGKHVFCEKPFTLTRADAEAAVRAADEAGVLLALGYNRRFHPAWIDLKNRIAAGELGAMLHFECTMAGPNGLNPAPGAWRADPGEAPCGGLFPMGVHAIDGFVDLGGAIESVFCQSFRRAVPTSNDDTTSMLFRLAMGPSAYLATMTATAGTFRFSAYGSKGAAHLGGATHIAGQSSHQRRSGLFGSYIVTGIDGVSIAPEVAEFDVNRAELEAFARAVAGECTYPIPTRQMIEVVAATEAAIASARSGSPQIVQPAV